MPVLIKEGPPEVNPWGIKFKQGLFNIALLSDLWNHRFRTTPALRATLYPRRGNSTTGMRRYMTSDSHLFRTREQLEVEGWRLVGNVFERQGERYLPLYQKHDPFR